MIMDPFEYAHKHFKDIVWMSQNTNQLPTTPKVDEEIIKMLRAKQYNLYPYAKGLFGLRDAISEDLGLEGYEALITGGAIEALYILNRALLNKESNVIATDPSFMPIHRQIKLSGGEPKELPIYHEPWKLEADKANEAIDKNTKMILLIDPLNPLGSSYTRNEVKALCEVAEDHDLYMLDDITYRDFADSHTLTSEFLPEKSIIVYSFSKNCGLAGLRIGAVLTEPKLMKIIQKYVVNPLSVNILAQRAALVSLQTKHEWTENMVRVSRENQERIKDMVDKIDDIFLPVYPSYTNMFIIDIQKTGIDPIEMQKKLLYEHNIFVRAGNYVSTRFGHNFIRVSFTVPQEGIQRFVDTFPAVVEELRK